MNYYSNSEEVRNLVHSNGYNIEHHNGTYKGESFVKGTRHIWRIREGYQTADVINGYYCNHIHFEDLETALKRPLVKYLKSTGEAVMVDYYTFNGKIVLSLVSSKRPSRYHDYPTMEILATDEEELLGETL